MVDTDTRTSIFNSKNAYGLPIEANYFYSYYSHNKRRLFVSKALCDFYSRDGMCLLRSTEWILKCNPD
jgi:hypothetical protein